MASILGKCRNSLRIEGLQCRHGGVFMYGFERQMFGGMSSVHMGLAGDKQSGEHWGGEDELANSR